MAFHEYLDDFNVFSDFRKHLAKLQLCFDKCWKFGISLNPKKCMFFIYSRVILLGYIVSKAGKWLEKNLDNGEYVCTKNAKRRTCLQWDGPILLMFHQELCLHCGPHHKILEQNRGVWMDYQMLGNVGGQKIMVSGWIDLNYTQVRHGVPHPHKCVKFSCLGYASSKSYQKMWSAKLHTPPNS